MDKPSQLDERVEDAIDENIYEPLFYYSIGSSPTHVLPPPLLPPLLPVDLPLKPPLLPPPLCCCPLLKRQGLIGIEDINPFWPTQPSIPSIGSRQCHQQAFSTRSAPMPPTCFSTESPLCPSTSANDSSSLCLADLVAARAYEAHTGVGKGAVGG